MKACMDLGRTVTLTVTTEEEAELSYTYRTWTSGVCSFRRARDKQSLIRFKTELYGFPAGLGSSIAMTREHSCHVILVANVKNGKSHDSCLPLALSQRGRVCVGAMEWAHVCGEG